MKWARMRKLVVILVAAVLILGGILAGCGAPPGQRELERGIREMRRGNYVRAKALLEKSILRRPGSVENAVAYNYLGLACWRLNQIEAAVDAFEDSRRLNPDSVAPTYNLGVVMYKAGDLFRAAALLEEAALVDLNDARPLEFLGYLYRRAGEWGKARRALYSALERASQSPRVLTALALVELRAVGPEEAVRYLARALECDARYAPALYNLGMIHAYYLRNQEAAQAYLREFLRLRPQGPWAEAARHAMAGPVPPPTAVSAAATAAAPAAAATPAAPAPAVTAGAPLRAVSSAPEEAPEALIAQARKEASEGRTAQALNLFLQAAARAEKLNRPRDREQALRLAAEVCFDQPRAHYAYGRFLAEQGRPAAALAAFKQAVVLNPRWAAAHEALADAAIEVGEYDAALMALRKTVELDRTNPEAWWKLAKLCDEKLESPKSAAAAYREFRRLFPGDPRVLEAEKRLSALEPSPSSAPERAAQEAAPPAGAEEESPKQLVRQAAAAASGYARRLNLPKPEVRNTRAAVEAYNRGTLYQGRQDWDRAIYYYRKALENDDTFAEAYYNLGSAYQARGDLDLAKDAYLHAIQLRPDMANARYNLALTYWELQEYTAAEEAAESVLKLRPDDAGAHYLLGLIYSRTPATHERAAAHYRRFLELEPNAPAAARVREWLSSR